MMIFVNAVYKEEKISKDYAEGFIKLLNPIAPHITEEIWNVFLGHGKTIANESWPIFDESKIKEENHQLVVQVNGKVRGKIEIDANLSDDEIKELALNEPNVKRYVDGNEILKLLIINKKIVSIVIK